MYPISVSDGRTEITVPIPVTTIGDPGKTQMEPCINISIMHMSVSSLREVPEISLVKKMVVPAAGVDDWISHVTKSLADESVTLMANNSVSISSPSLIVLVADTMLFIIGG